MKNKPAYIGDPLQISDMKKDIINLLKSGSQYAVGHRWEEYASLFPLVKPITRNVGTSKNLQRNGNWFWAPANDKNRIALLECVKKIKNFTEEDKYFKQALFQYNKGDRYGILKDVPRAERASVKERDFDYAFDKYVANGDVNSGNRFFYKEKMYKVVYCQKRGIPFYHIDAWHRYELLLEKPLTFLEYKAIDELVFGSPDALYHIYTTEEYYDTLESLLDKLEVYRDSVPCCIDETVVAIRDEFLRGSVEKGYSLWCRLCMLHEVPDGTQSLDVRKARLRYRKSTKRIPEHIVKHYTDLAEERMFPAFSPV